MKCLREKCCWILYAISWMLLRMQIRMTLDEIMFNFIQQKSKSAESVASPFPGEDSSRVLLF